jgi:hypothetical protein
VGTSKILALYKGSTISLQAAVHLGHRPRAPMMKKKKKKHSAFVAKGSSLILYWEKVAFCYEVLTKCINVGCCVGRVFDCEIWWYIK